VLLASFRQATAALRERWLLSSCATLPWTLLQYHPSSTWGHHGQHRTKKCGNACVSSLLASTNSLRESGVLFSRLARLALPPEGLGYGRPFADPVGGAQLKRRSAEGQEQITQSSSAFCVCARQGKPRSLRADTVRMLHWL
jgi:hypothetical protein